jgi:hypothetical protein
MNTKQSAPSIYNDSVREYLRWARTQNDYTLIEQIKIRIGEQFRFDYIEGDQVSYAITDSFLLKHIRLVNKILRIRNSVRKLVSDCCATANGSPYTETKGWWIIPMLTQDKTIGLINIAKGVALDTGIKLSCAQIGEMAIRTKKIQSGNMAAEAHNASYPEGWIQLLADSRGGEIRPVSEFMPNARIVKRGLMTCYKTEGGPNENFEMACGWPREQYSPFCEGSEKKVA